MIYNMTSMLNLVPTRLQYGTHTSERGHVTRSGRGMNQLFTTPIDDLSKSIQHNKQTLEAYQQKRNLNDMISLHQVAEGALSTLTSSLYRLDELAIQASSDFLREQDRVHLQSSADHLVSEIAKIITQTKFQDKTLFKESISLGFPLSNSPNLILPSFNVEQLFTHQGLDRSKDHDVVFIIDSSKSTKPQISEILDKISEYAQSYQQVEGSLAVGIIYTPMSLKNPQGEREIEVQPLVNLTDDTSGNALAEIKSFIDHYEPTVGQIDLKESIQYATHEFNWHPEAHQSLILMASNGGEGVKNGVVNAVEEFVDQSDRNTVSAIGIPEKNKESSDFFINQVVPAGEGVYQNYTSELDMSDYVNSTRSDTRIVSGIDLSSTLRAQESQDVIDHIFEQIIHARSTLGAHQIALKTHRELESEKIVQLGAQEARRLDQHFARTLADQAQREISQKRHVFYQSKALQYFGQQMLRLIEAQ